jgi:hypothetical protein
VEEAFRANFEEGQELGASLALHGVADGRGSRRLVEHQAHLSLRRTRSLRLLDDEDHAAALRPEADRPEPPASRPDRFAATWKAFGQGGKESESATSSPIGVPGFVPPISVMDLTDWDRMTAHIAAQPHRFSGEKVLYHALTYGYVLGELIRRVDGRMPSRYFREEFAERIGADFHMGVHIPAAVASLGGDNTHGRANQYAGTEECLHRGRSHRKPWLLSTWRRSGNEILAICNSDHSGNAGLFKCTRDRTALCHHRHEWTASLAKIPVEIHCFGGWTGAGLR